MIRLRITETEAQSFYGQLLARDDVETAGVILAEPLRAEGGLVLVARRTVILPESAYQVRAVDQLQIDPVALNRIVRPARERGWSVFTIHTHPGASEPWFSWADDSGDDRLMPSLHAQIDAGVHGSMVLTPGGATIARAFGADRKKTSVSVSTIGRRLITDAAARAENGDAFSRQIIALGADGHAALRRIRVAVVGLGGTGSIVSAQLAHMGVRDLVLMDGDVVESSNLSRIFGASIDDVGSMNKADVAARYARATGLGVVPIVVPRMLRGESELRMLRNCDVVFSCVDRHTPRALLNRLAYDALVPVIDMGTAFRVDTRGVVVGDAGRVVVVGPRRRCLACFGHLDPESLRREALSVADRKGEEQAGYVDGAHVAQPSVMAFNVSVAGAAVVEFLRLVAGFAGTDDPPQRLAFSFSDGTVKRNRVAGERRCTICDLSAAAARGEQPSDADRLDAG